MKPVRLGVIGLGLIWVREHKPMLDTLQDVFEPVAFCDVSEERRAAIAQEFPDAVVFADYQSLLASPAVETVLVLTPIALNAPVALAALKAGKDVMMEKPIARSVDEGRELIATARRAGKRLFVMEQMGYRRGDAVVAELIRSGEIGDLVMWNRVQHSDADMAQGPLRYASTPWRRAANFPLGTLFDGGIHLIAGLTRMFGAPETVFATGKQLRPDYGEYDHVTMTFQYAGGVVGMLSHAACLPPAQNHFHIHGAKGVMVVERNYLLVEKTGQPKRTIDLPVGNERADMWHAFAAAYRDNHEPDYTAAQALRDVAILATVDQSIKAGQRQLIAGATLSE